MNQDYNIGSSSIFRGSMLHWENILFIVNKYFVGFNEKNVWLSLTNFSWGGGQNLEQSNVEWAIFQNYKIANIKITKDELFDFFDFEFFKSFYICLKYSNTKIYDNS